LVPGGIRRCCLPLPHVNRFFFLFPRDFLTSLLLSFPPASRLWNFFSSSKHRLHHIATILEPLFLRDDVLCAISSFFPYRHLLRMPSRVDFPLSPPRWLPSVSIMVLPSSFLPLRPCSDVPISAGFLPSLRPRVPGFPMFHFSEQSRETSPPASSRRVLCLLLPGLFQA